MKQQHRGRFGRRALAAVGIAALAVLGAFGSASAANAVEQGSNVGNIDPNATGSITVHKHKELGSDANLKPDGSQSPPNDPLAGVEFTVTKVTGIDLTDPQAWSVLASLEFENGTVTDGGSTTFGLDTANAQTLATTADGSAAFSGLGVGVYLVQEGAAPDALNIVKKAEPFFVTLPLPDGGKWLYNVHVYPKNAVGGITKSVDSSGAVKIGDTVKWTVSAVIPKLNNEALSLFTVSDTFDSRLEAIAVSSVKIDGVDVAYTSDVDPGNAQKVTVTPDLGVVNANQGKTVEIVFTTKVKSIGDGTIKNQAFVNLPDNISLPSNEPATKWGAVKIEKYNAENGVGDRLNGAKFALYRTQAEAQAAATAGSATGTPVWTGTTSGNGEAQIDGLYVGDTTDGVTTRTYYLVETEAPAGYLRTTNVISVEVTPGSIAQATVKQVGNTQLSPVTLPLTGSTGAVMLSVAGVALLGTAAGTALIVSRRKQAVK